MKEIINSLDSRDLAIAIWLGILMLWSASKPEIRKSFKQVISAFTELPIAVTFCLAFLYLIATTLFLQHLNLWTLSQFKITVLWLIFTGFASLMDISEISKNPSRLKRILSKNFEFSILLAFFINIFKLPFIAELIFVPLTALLGAMLAIAQSDEKHATVQKLINGIFSIIGTGLIVFETYKAVTNFGTVANINTFRDFVLPIIYNLAFIPLILVISIYVAYDSAFGRLQFFITDNYLHRHTKQQLILGFRININALNIWIKEAWCLTLTSREEITQSIMDCKQKDTE